MERKEYGCPTEFAVSLIGGKWKVLILWHLLSGTKRFAELKRKIPGITQKMLTQQLRELEADRLIQRKVYAQVPPKVEYSLAEFGEQLRPIILQLNEWGRVVYNQTQAEEESV